LIHLGLNDSNNNDQENLDNIFDFCQNENPFDGIILMIEKTNKLKDSLQKLLQCYNILLKLNDKHKITICITRTLDKNYLNEISKEFENKKLLNCRYDIYCWELNKNDNILYNIIKSCLDNNEQFKSFNSVLTIENKIKLYDNERKQNQSKIEDLEVQLKIKNNDYKEIEKLRNEMNLLINQKENINQKINISIDKKNKHTHYDYDDCRCRGRTLKGQRCKNTINCPHHKKLTII